MRPTTGGRLRVLGAAGTVGLLVVIVTPVGAQQEALAERVGDLDGEVAFHFAGRDGVEGCGDDRVSFGPHRSGGGWGTRSPSPCGPGPVLVALEVRDGEVRSVETRVGPRVHERRRWAGDLGRVSPAEAADYLLHLARRGPASVADAAVFPAFLARDVEVWPKLLELARDRSRPRSVRSRALFWVGQEAAGVGTEGLAAVAEDEAEDREIRDAAVFALSQRPAGEGVPLLMELAREAPDTRIRRSALFWLAQSDDPMVIDFFEELLTAQR